MSRQIKFEPITRLDFDTSTLTASYQPMDASGLSNETQIFKMINASDVAVDISFDGSNDHDYIPAGGSFILDLNSNSALSAGAFSKGTHIYLKGPSAGTGNIYAMGYKQRIA